MFQLRNLLQQLNLKRKVDRTFLKWHMLFESKEQFIQVVKTFKADEGLKQNVEKLQHYLASLSK